MGQVLRKHNWQPRSRARRRPNDWGKSPKGDKRTLTLVPSENTWPPIEEQCKTVKANISQGYKEAIALLRSLRNVSEEEAQEQRKTWEMLEQALDEDRYH